MTTEPTPSPNAARLERTYDAPAKLIWELLTTAAGLEEWWAPDGFETRVNELELRPGGQLRYTMTATAPEQVAFMRNTGNSLSIELHKTFTQVAPPTRLAYLSLFDFVPDHEPYEHLTTIDIEPAGDYTDVVLTVDPLHNETWSVKTCHTLRNRPTLWGLAKETTGSRQHETQDGNHPGGGASMGRRPRLPPPGPECPRRQGRPPPGPRARGRPPADGRSVSARAGRWCCVTGRRC